MKKEKRSQFVPILTSDAGRSLTVANWEEVDVKIAAYDLTSLLMKPGMELLSSLPDLKTYTGWHGTLVLNASMSVMDKEGGYMLRSEYDGSRRHYMSDDVMSLIAQLKPQMVLLPAGINHTWQSLSKNMLPFFTAADRPLHIDRPHGVYFIYDKSAPFSLLAQQVQAHTDIPRYVSGELSLDLMRELASLGVEYLASDFPARDACHGSIYHDEGVMSLKSDLYRMDFNVIDEKCHCPTCEQKLTRAYLHHLFEHTPLLCQRFLIQHNIAKIISVSHLRQP